MPRSASLGASVLLGLGFAVLAFAGGGGLQLDDATRVELPIIAVGGLVLALGLLYGRGGPLCGALPLTLFVALAAYTALSIAWSIAPSDSWAEANRTVAYLMAFAAALVAARLVPEGWAPLIGALAIGLGAVAVYALLTRVWPDALSANDQYARISEPLGYWNAVGAAAAMAVPPVLWLGVRRRGHPLITALAFPLLGALIVTMLLTQSRGALLAAAAAAGLWLALVPLRIRSLPLLLVPILVAVPVAAWALSRGAFTIDRAPNVVRSSAASEFGAMLAIGALVLLAVGLVVGFRQSTHAPSVVARRRLGLALAAGVLALPLIGVSALAASDRGLAGSVSYRVQQLTAEETATAGGPQRFTQVSSSRGRYWRQAGSVFSQEPILGTGADTWGTARLRYRTDQVPARHAHGYVPQVMSDLGLIGLLLALGLGAAWLYVALRNTGLHPWARGRTWSAERVGLVTLGLVAVTFGLHSAVDWTWIVPGPAVMAMVAAGWVAGRGGLWDEEEPFAAQPGAAPAAGPGVAGAPATAGPPPGRPGGPDPGQTAVLPSVGGVALTAGELPEAPSAGDRLKEVLRRDGWRLTLALATVVATALFAWSAWQPQRAEVMSERALALVEAGRLPEAAAAADRARFIDPLSPRPVFARATVADAARRPAEAEALLRLVVREHPADPRGWLRLGDYQLHQLNRPRQALETLRAAVFLDPQSRAARSYFLEARARSAAGGQQPGGQNGQNGQNGTSS